MHIIPDSSPATVRTADVCDLNCEIKSRCANLRSVPYKGSAHIEWERTDCEMSPTITAGLTYGADGGDRESFLTRVLAARFTSRGEELRLLFGESAEPIRPYSIQLARAECNGAPCIIKVWAKGEVLRILLTVSGKDWDGLDPWIQCVMEAFSRCPVIFDAVMPSAVLR